MKFVKYTPDGWKSELFEYINGLNVNLLNGNITQYFQYNPTCYLNPHANTLSEVIIPGVFLYDEVTTNAYSKCIIEMLTRHGILIKASMNVDEYKWLLQND